MSKNPKLKVALGCAALFMGLIVVILVLLIKQVISAQMALLMFVALLGCYVGFGILIAAWRFTHSLR